MAVSPSGVLTLFAIIVVGPTVWACYEGFKRLRCIKRRRKSSESPGSESQGTALAGQGSEAREEFGSSEYLIVMLGYAIGIGNLWRFPYLVGKYGGGAFVLAYVTCLFIVAIPLFLMELVLGQYTRRAPIQCYDIVRPRWATLGYSQAILCCVTLAYYCVLIAYAGVYIIASLTDPLPWSRVALENTTQIGGNATQPATEGESAALRFWQVEVLNQYDDVEGRGFGPLQPHLVGSLLVVWLLTFVTLAFGKSVLAKVTGITVVMPVMLLIALLLKSVTLDGAADGIAFYLGKFDAERLLDLETWAIACSQILFSLGPGFGTAITMSSYTHPKEDLYRACFLIALSNSGFSLMGGFAIFSILGNLALSTGQTVEEVASVSGTGLAFISIAEGMLSFGEGANAMSVIFFIVLYCLGLDSTFAWAETLTGYIKDYFAATGRQPPQWKIIGSVCVIFFILGLPFCTRLGGALLDVTDHFGVPYALLLGTFVESLMFNLDFGWERFVRVLRNATVSTTRPLGRVLTPRLFWKTCLRFTAPLLTLALFVDLFVEDLVAPYGGYPVPLQVLGWILVVLLLSPIAVILCRGGESKLHLVGVTAQQDGASGAGAAMAGAPASSGLCMASHSQVEILPACGLVELPAEGGSNGSKDGKEVTTEKSSANVAAV